MELKVNDKVIYKNDIMKPIGTVIYVLTENVYIEQPNGKKTLFASPGDVKVNFDMPGNRNTGKVLNIAELEKVN